jgi:hypothetical protein
MLPLRAKAESASLQTRSLLLRAAFVTRRVGEQEERGRREEVGAPPEAEKQGRGAGLRVPRQEQRTGNSPEPLVESATLYSKRKPYRCLPAGCPACSPETLRSPPAWRGDRRWPKPRGTASPGHSPGSAETVERRTCISHGQFVIRATASRLAAPGAAMRD